MTDYPGSITRQELVNFLKDHDQVISKEIVREQDLLDKHEKTMTDAQYETLMLSISSLIGKKSMLRTLSDWAQNKVEENGTKRKEMVENGIRGT